MVRDQSTSFADTLFRDLDAETIRAVVLAASDVALLLDGHGTVRDLEFRGDGLRGELDDNGDWLGRSWRTAMTVESRPKLDAMISDARAGRPIRWRQLNHPAADGIDVAISWSAVPSMQDDTMILLGRDLRQTAALQQRLVETQQFLERDYLALRRTEARYRILFETAQDGIAVLDATSLRPVELNPAARRLFGRDARRALGRPFPDSFGPDRAAVTDLLAAARTGALPEPLSVQLDGNTLRLAVSSLREDENSFLLARLLPQDAAPAAVSATATRNDAVLPELLALMPDAAVLCDEEGDVLAANDAFRSLAGLLPEQPIEGEPLSRWIGRDGVDLPVLIGNLRQRGAVRAFATEAHGEDGIRTPVEISGSLRPNGAPGFAFYLRDIGRRPRPAERPAPEGMGALIGRVPLKELVRESTEAIERLCIESALDMTGNNRASAADMLGLSRQSLYVKLRRFGMVEPDGVDAHAGAGAAAAGDAT